MLETVIGLLVNAMTSNFSSGKYLSILYVYIYIYLYISIYTRIYFNDKCSVLQTITTF